MDQRQRYDMHGYGSSGYGTQDSRGWESFTEYEPYHPPERHESYGNQPMVSSLAHTHNGSSTEDRSLGGEVPNPQRGLQFGQLYRPYFATNPEILDKHHAYSGNILLQGSPNGYRPADWTLQGEIQRRSQEGGILNVMQPESESFSHHGPRYPNSFSPYGPNSEWRPVEQLSPSSNGAPNFPHPASSSVCANCGNHPHVDRNRVYQPEQRDVSSSMDWRLQEANIYLLRPTEEDVLSNRQLSTQETRLIAAYNGRLGASNSEQSRPGFSVQMSAAVNSLNSTMTVHAYNNSANNGHKKKRKRKPRAVKPRKPRTLTVEGKAHAKAVREFPGGACEDCKRKKTKARDQLVAYLVSTYS